MPELMKVRLLGSYTLDLLAQALRKAAGGAADVDVAPYGQFRQVLLADAAPVPGRVNVLVTDLDAWVPDGASGLLEMPPEARGRLRAELVAEVAGFAARLASRGERLVAATLSPSVPLLLGMSDWMEPEGEQAWVHAANAALAEALRSTPGSGLWDLALLRARFGAEASEDPRLRFLGDVRMAPAFSEAAARDLARHLRALTAPPRKVLALDLDNTLWGGVLGEEGMGVVVGKETPAGKAFLAFQERVLALKRRGVVLVVSSKNDEAAALEVIDRHPGMRIRRTDLAAWRINWEDKAAQLRSLAEELRLGLDSFAFWDDQPFEREWVRKACPEVAVAEVPPDPARYASALAAWDAFDAPRLTDEDRQRAAQYVSDRSRKDLERASASLDDYLKALAIRVKVVRAGVEDLGRVAQLFQKTNQFNLTTRRLDEAALRPLLNDPGSRLLVMRLWDRFGDQGTVGVALLRHRDGMAELSDFLMSCRVLGREAETALLAACFEEAARGRAGEVMARFVPTDRNGVARDFLPRHGFVPAGGDGLMRRNVSPPPAWPAWIQREEVT